MPIQYSLELTGTFFFAISGALAMQGKDQDWFSAAFTGFITAIGGGSLRDILLGSYPLVWIADINFLYSILAGVIVAIIFYRVITKLPKTFLVFDALGISFFTILGVEKAIGLGVRPEIAAIMGMFTAVMGGVIRDTLTNEVPVILPQRDLRYGLSVRSYCLFDYRFANTYRKKLQLINFHRGNHFNSTAFG